MLRLNLFTSLATDQLLTYHEHVDLGVMVHGTEHFRGIANLVYGFQEVKDLGGMHAVSLDICLSMYGCTSHFSSPHNNISCVCLL